MSGSSGRRHATVAAPATAPPAVSCSARDRPSSTWMPPALAPCACPACPLQVPLLPRRGPLGRQVVQRPCAAPCEALAAAVSSWRACVAEQIGQARQFRCRRVWEANVLRRGLKCGQHQSACLLVAQALRVVARLQHSDHGQRCLALPRLCLGPLGGNLVWAVLDPLGSVSSTKCRQAVAAGQPR